MKIGKIGNDNLDLDIMQSALAIIYILLGLFLVFFLIGATLFVIGLFAGML